MASQFHRGGCDIRNVALTLDQQKALAACYSSLKQGNVTAFLTLVSDFGHEMGHEIARRALILAEQSRAA